MSPITHRERLARFINERNKVADFKNKHYEQEQRINKSSAIAVMATHNVAQIEQWSCFPCQQEDPEELTLSCTHLG